MIKIGTALFEAAEQFEREKGISKEVLISSLCDALAAAYKKHIKDKDAMILLILRQCNYPTNPPQHRPYHPSQE